MQGDAGSGENSILAKLSGLKLSDGLTAAERAKFQSTPPSTVMRSGVLADAPVSSASTVAGITKLLSDGILRVGSPPASNHPAPTSPNRTRNHGNSDGEKEKPTITMKDGKVVECPKPRSETLARKQQASPKTRGLGESSPSHSNEHRPAAKGPEPSLLPSAAVTAAASPAAIVVVNDSRGQPALNPKVAEFFSKHSSFATLHHNVGGGGSADANSAPPEVTMLLASTPAADPKVAATQTSTAGSPLTGSRNGDGNAIPSTSAPLAEGDNKTVMRSTEPTVEEKRAALEATKFLRDQLGLINNSTAEGPVVRTLPALPVGGRFIIVGDVHGCVDQLEALIKKVQYEKEKDCLILIGDYVNKGPDSIGVVQACIKHQALGVLGNHDYTLLKCIDMFKRRGFRPADLRDPVKKLAKVFPLDCEYYLRGLPHILKLPEYNVVLVHAGLNTQHALEDQSAYEIMHLRRLEQIVTSDPAHHKEEVVKYQAVIKGSAGVPWGELWEGPELVVFGHDAYSGFQAHRSAIGIDTGCVYGNPLTCVVFDKSFPMGEFYSVPGLPKQANELKGLPPPYATVYEQQQTLAQQIIRPTTRNTPSLASNSLISKGAGPPIAQRLGFLSSPVYQGVSTPVHPLLPAAANTRLTPSSAAVAAFMSFPSQGVMTPNSVMGATMALEMSDVSARETQKATLLALSAARELTAIAVLLSMPLYETSLEAAQRAEAADAVAIGAFWAPFVRNILSAVLHRLCPSLSSASSPCSSSSPLPPEGGITDAEEETFLYALSVCDETDAVRQAAMPVLKALQESCSTHLSTTARKYIYLSAQ